MSDDENRNETADNPFDRSVHDEPTQKVPTLPHLLRKAGRPPAELPSSLEEETAVGDDAEKTPDEQPGNKTTEREGDKKPPKDKGDDKPQRQGDDEPRRQGEEKPPKDKGDDETSADFGGALQIDLDDSFFDELFEDDA